MSSFVFLKAVALAVLMPLSTVAATADATMDDATPIIDPSPPFALGGFDHVGKATAKPVIERLENGHLQVNARFKPPQTASQAYCAFFQSTDEHIVGMLDDPFPVHRGVEARYSAELFTAAELETVGLSIDHSGYMVFAMCADGDPLSPVSISKFYAMRKDLVALRGAGARPQRTTDASPRMNEATSFGLSMRTAVIIDALTVYARTSGSTAVPPVDCERKYSARAESPQDRLASTFFVTG